MQIFKLKAITLFNLQSPDKIRLYTCEFIKVCNKNAVIIYIFSTGGV